MVPEAFEHALIVTRSFYVLRHAADFSNAVTKDLLGRSL